MPNLVCRKEGETMLPCLIGNSAIKQQLRGKLSHAYLIAGQQGSGRGVVLRHFAQKALCDSPEETSCGVCKSCQKFERNSHPDIHYYGEDKIISVDAVRQIQKEIYVRPNESSKAVYVLFRSDEMLQPAQNALLKSLEDPPPYVMFLLITGESGGVLETIRSRCHCLTLRPISYDESFQWLQQRYPSIHQGLEETARQCQGILGKALDEMEPMRKKLENENIKSDTDGIQFHTPLKGKGAVGKKTTKKVAEKKGKNPELENFALQQLAQKIAEDIIRGNELSLYQSCCPLEKIGKAQLLELIESIIDCISKELIRVKGREYLQYRNFLQQIHRGVEGNIAGGQLVGWITAGVMEIRRGGVNEWKQ